MALELRADDPSYGLIWEDGYLNASDLSIWSGARRVTAQAPIRALRRLRTAPYRRPLSAAAAPPPRR